VKHKAYCTDCGSRVMTNNPVAALRWHRRYCVPRRFRRWPRNTVSMLDHQLAGGRKSVVRDQLWQKGYLR
jgi:hypothetical protein